MKLPFYTLPDIYLSQYHANHCNADDEDDNHDGGPSVLLSVHYQEVPDHRLLLHRYMHHDRRYMHMT